MAQKSLQLLRNTTVFASLAAAKTRMPNVTDQDGVAVLGRYLDASGETKTILGIRHTMGDVTGMTFFENADEIQAKIDALQAELDTTQATIDTNADGTKKASTSHFTSAATTIEAEIAALAAALEALNYSKEVGESEVFSKVIETEGKLSAETKNLTAVKLAGYQEGTDADIAATDTLGEALGKLQAQINAMDKDADVVAGQVVTTVAEADGKVTETKANVKDLQLGGYQKTNDTGDIASADTVNVALSKLENQIGANKIVNDDGSINVTEAGTGTTIDVHIKTGEKVLANDANKGGLYTDIKLSSVTPSSDAVKEEYSLIATDGSVLGDTNIKIYKDSHIVSITYITDSGDTHYQNLEYKYIDASGATKTEYVDISSLVLEAEFASGVTVTNHVAHGVVDSTSEKDESNVAFLTVGADGFKVSGIKDAIDTKINKLDVTGDTAVAGQYVAAIEETDGLVAVKTRANVSDAVLNGYAKGEKPASTAVAATDDVKGAIAKLEWQAAAATTEVVEGTDTASVMEISSSTAADGHTVYTIDLEDVAKASEVGLSTAGTHVTTTGHYTSQASTVVGEIAALDTALNQLSGKSVTEITSNNGSITPTKTALADGTQTYDLATDASLIKMTGFDPNVEESACTPPSSTDTVASAMSKLYAVAKHHHLSGSSAIGVAQTTSGATVSLILDDSTSATTANNQYASDSGNALKITDDGLYLSSAWDCGTF